MYYWFEHRPYTQHQGLCGQFAATYQAYIVLVGKHGNPDNMDKFWKNLAIQFEKYRWPRIVSRKFFLSPANTEIETMSRELELD